MIYPSGCLTTTARGWGPTRAGRDDAGSGPAPALPLGLPGVRMAALPSWPPLPPFPTLSSPHTRPPSPSINPGRWQSEWQQPPQQQGLCTQLRGPGRQRAVGGNFARRFPHMSHEGGRSERFCAVLSLVGLRSKAWEGFARAWKPLPPSLLAHAQVTDCGIQVNVRDTCVCTPPFRVLGFV